MNGKQTNDAPHRFRWQITDGNKQQAIDGIEHEDIAIVKRHVDKTKHEQQAHTPSKTTREAFALLLLVVVHDEETQSEEHGEDAIHLATQQPSQHFPHKVIAWQCIHYRLFRKDIEMLHGVIQDDACHGDTS